MRKNKIPPPLHGKEFMEFLKKSVELVDSWPLWVSGSRVTEFSQIELCGCGQPLRNHWRGKPCLQPENDVESK